MLDIRQTEHHKTHDNFVVLQMLRDDSIFVYDSIIQKFNDSMIKMD